MDAGDSAFFAWEIGWTVHALKTDPAQPAAREHLPPAALHARDGRAGARHHAAGAAARALHRRRGAALQRRPAAHVPLLRAHGLLAGERAGRGRVDRAPRGRALRVLADPHRPGGPPLDARDAVVAARAAVHDPLREAGAGEGRAAGRALLRARVPGLRLPRGDRRGGAAAGARWCCSGAAGTGSKLGALAAVARRPRAAAASTGCTRRRSSRSATRAGPRRRSSTRRRVESFLATSSWNRVYGEATDAFRAVGPEQPVPRAWWCRGWSLAGAIALRRRGERPSPRGLGARGAAAGGGARGARAAGARRSAPISGPGRGRSCATRCRSSR